MAGRELYSTRPPVPLDALRLTEDVWTLARCRELLDRVDTNNITEERELGWKILQLVKQELRTCERYATNKLRKEYLSPSKKKVGK